MPLLFGSLSVPHRRHIYLCTAAFGHFHTLSALLYDFISFISFLFISFFSGFLYFKNTYYYCSLFSFLSIYGMRLCSRRFSRVIRASIFPSFLFISLLLLIFRFSSPRLTIFLLLPSLKFLCGYIRKYFPQPSTFNSHWYIFIFVSFHNYACCSFAWRLQIYYFAPCLFSGKMTFLSLSLSYCLSLQKFSSLFCQPCLWMVKFIFWCITMPYSLH